MAQGKAGYVKYPPPGGTVGQALVKITNEDWEMEWGDVLTEIAIGGSIPGGVATEVLFVGTGGVLAQSANLTYSETSGPRLRVGSGAVGNAGFILGNLSGATGYVFLQTTGLSISSANCALQQGPAGDTYLNSASGKNLSFQIANSTKARINASGGFEILCGAQTSDINALSATQTWNASGVAFTGIKFTITDTASAAGSLAMQILGGASGTTSLFKVTKGGQVDAPSYAVGGSAGASFGPGAVTSITVVNGIVTAIS